MWHRIPVWVSAPAIIGLVLGTIWVVGKSEMGSAQSPEIVSAAVPDSDKPTIEVIPASDRKQFPDFSGPMAGGSIFSLSSQKGKVVLVNFWATWCGPCRMEIPDLIALQKKYGPRGFVVVGLSQDDDFAQAKTFALQNGMIYPVLKTPQNVNDTVEMNSLPISYLLDRDGKVMASFAGVLPQVKPEDLWSPAIEKAL